MTIDWKPNATLEALRQRAESLARIRKFFAERRVLEVETPVLGKHGVTDPHIQSVPAAHSLWLRTSPEYHMKRLLASGSGDIFQTAKVFRDGESGRYHQPEFTMLEWYRLGFSLTDMISETCELICALGDSADRPFTGFKRIEYRQAFVDACGLDPLVASTDMLVARARELRESACDDRLAKALGSNRNAWLDYLASHVVYPSLQGECLWVVERYPADQAMLARLDPDDQSVAERFEVFCDGIELANGFRELLDADEQEARFARERVQRNELKLIDMLPDTLLLDALRSGMPDCCGVALGLDRVLMIANNHRDIAATMSFKPGS